MITFRKLFYLFKNTFAVVTEIILFSNYLQIANSMVSTWTGPPAMKSLFTRMFCCKTCPNIVKTNNFMSFQSYFLQKVQFPFWFSYNYFMPISVYIHLPWGLFKYYLLSYKYFVFFLFFASEILSKVLIILWFYELCASDSLSTLILKSIEMGSVTLWLGPWGMEAQDSLEDGGVRGKWMLRLFGWVPGGWRRMRVPLMLLGLRPSGMRHAAPG